MVNWLSDTVFLAQLKLAGLKYRVLYSLPNLKTQVSNSRRSMRRAWRRWEPVVDAIMAAGLTVLLIPVCAFLLTLFVVIAQQ